MKKNITALSFAILLAGCGGGGGGGSSSTPSTSNTGSISLGVTDTPIGSDVTHVYVQFHGVELQGPSGQQTITFTSPIQVDLLEQTGTKAAALLSNHEIPAGDYQWVRLLVDTDGNNDTYLVDGTGNHELTVPSGAETGLKLVQGFTVAQGGHVDFIADFNVAKSVHINNNGYFLRPTLRLIDNLQVGTLTGHVDTSTLIAAHCSGSDVGAIYIYEGAGMVPADISGAATDPLTTAKVVADGSGAYTVGFLEAGSYTAAWTCMDAQDDPTAVDTLTFFDAQSFTITANATTTLNFN